jgi:hypothetical protein
MKRKAQAAMEFLMTYGWAILVVLAAIGALAYFGVLSPVKFLPERCTFPPGIACLDSKITADSTEMLIQNSLGRDITVNSVSLGNCSQNYNIDFPNGVSSIFTISCDNGETGAKYKSDIAFEYTNKDSGMQKTAYGEIMGKVQQ